MNNKDKVVIGSAILVVLAVLIVLNNTFDYSGQGFRAGNCYDPDGGNYEYVRTTIEGHVYPSQENYEYTDYCLYGETNTLKEYMCLKDVSEECLDDDPDTDCDKSAWKSELIICENGCKNGACLR